MLISTCRLVNNPSPAPATPEAAVKTCRLSYGSLRYVIFSILQRIILPELGTVSFQPFG